MDVALAQAEWLYQRGDFQRCHDVVAEVLERDPFQLSALPCYLLSPLSFERRVILQRTSSWKNILSVRFHGSRWRAITTVSVNLTPRDDISVKLPRSGGLLSPRRLDRPSICRTRRERPSHGGVSHCCETLPWLPSPVLCIGMEYQRTNNLSLAEHFFGRAREICPSDPLVYNELGVLAYRNRDYTTAVSFLERAISLVPQPLTDRWEATVVNLAHANRKLNNFDDAIAWYERALSLAPRVASTYTALGFTHQLKGNFQSHMGEAIECYHKALGLRPDDTFAQEMLTLALIDQCAVTMPPYNHVSLDPYQPLPFVSRDGFDKIEVDSGEAGGEGIPEA